MSDLKIVGVILNLIVFSVLGLAISIDAIRLSFIENVPVICKVNGNEVYRGISGCITVESSGANSNVKINGGFLCWFPKAYYVSKNVELKNQ